MVLLLNKFVFYFVECFLLIRVKYVLQFSRRDDLTSKTLASICLDLYMKLREARRKEALLSASKHFAIV